MTKSFTALTLLLTATLVFAGCSRNAATDTTPQTTSETVSDTMKESSSESGSAYQPQSQEESQARETEASQETVPDSRETETQSNESQTAAQTAQETESLSSETASTGTLYIGSGDNFTEYAFTGEKTPDNLISAISDLTGWNLSLADPVTSGKGGMTVCFTKDCSIFTGPPDPQKDEFHAFDTYSLTQMILDSIKKTLQENYVDREAGGDPSNLDIYFCVMENGNITGISLLDGEINIPLDQPYEGLSAQ
mgnify:CR=1 FL=1